MSSRGRLGTNSFPRIITYNCSVLKEKYQNQVAAAASSSASAAPAPELLQAILAKNPNVFASKIRHGNLIYSISINYFACLIICTYVYSKEPSLRSPSRIYWFFLVLLIPISVDLNSVLTLPISCSNYFNPYTNCFCLLRFGLCSPTCFNLHLNIYLCHIMYIISFYANPHLFFIHNPLHLCAYVCACV